MVRVWQDQLTVSTESNSNSASSFAKQKMAAWLPCRDGRAQNSKRSGFVVTQIRLTTLGNWTMELARELVGNPTVAREFFTSWKSHLTAVVCATSARGPFPNRTRLASSTFVFVDTGTSRSRFPFCGSGSALHPGRRCKLCSAACEYHHNQQAAIACVTSSSAHGKSGSRSSKLAAAREPWQ
jgi:hypothetical protein